VILGGGNRDDNAHLLKLDDVGNPRHTREITHYYNGTQACVRGTPHKDRNGKYM
jgi:hypothetical protein